MKMFIIKALSPLDELRHIVAYLDTRPSAAGVAAGATVRYGGGVGCVVTVRAGWVFQR